MTYYDKIMKIITEELVGLDDIMKKLNVFNSKRIYIIMALKKGISLGKIRMIIMPNVKTKYKGHLFSLYPSKRYQEVHDSGILIKDLRNIITEYM